MGKASRTKKNKQNEKSAGTRALEGLTREQSRQVRAIRRGIWVATTPCERLRQLMGAHPDEISPGFQAALLVKFHAGGIDYDSAVAQILREIAIPILAPHFILCDERRLLDASDSGQFLDAFMDPVPSKDSDSVDGAGYLLIMAHTFFSEKHLLRYRATVVSTVKQLVQRATKDQSLLDSGELTWEQIHRDCRNERQAARAA